MISLQLLNLNINYWLFKFSAIALCSYGSSSKKLLRSRGGCSKSDKKGMHFGRSFQWVPVGMSPRNLVDMQLVRQWNPPEFCFEFGGKEATFCAVVFSSIWWKHFARLGGAKIRITPCFYESWRPICKAAVVLWALTFPLSALKKSLFSADVWTGFFWTFHKHLEEKQRLFDDA